MLKKFKDLTEKEILAIAIAAEEEDGGFTGVRGCAARRVSFDGADFEEMREEEVGHRDRLFAMFRQRFGEHIPLIRRENVKGFLAEETGVAGAAAGGERGAEAGRADGDGGGAVLRASREQDGGRFHAGLLNKLADEERKHKQTAEELEEKHLTASAKASEAESHRKLFLLQVVQAWAPRSDGWVDFNSGPAVCRGFCFQNSLERHSWSAWQHPWVLASRWDSRNHNPTRFTDGARFTLVGEERSLDHDYGRRNRTYAPFLISNFHVATIIASLWLPSS